MDKEKEIERMENEGSPIPADDSNYDNQMVTPNSYHQYIREKLDECSGENDGDNGC